MELYYVNTKKKTKMNYQSIILKLMKSTCWQETVFLLYQ